MCRCLVKFIIFFVNLIFLLIGLLVVGAGVYVVYHWDTVSAVTELINQLPNYEINLDFVPYVIIGLGIVVFLISFSGCCGTITETKCLLVTYAVCMAVLAAAKIVITILVFLNLTGVTNTVETTLNDMFLSDDPYQNATFHYLEARFKCCGTTGPDAYVNDYNLTSPTCCELGGNTTLENLPIDNLPILTNLTSKNIDRENAPIDLGNLPANIGDIDLGNIDIGNLPIDIENLGNLTMCKREDAFETGCTTLMGGAVKKIGKSVGIGLIVIIVFELFAMFFTIYLIKTMKPKNPKYIEQTRPYNY